MSAALLHSPEAVADQTKTLEKAPLVEVLQWAHEAFGMAAAIGTSFQGAGLVMIHHAVTAGIALPVFTLDTGLLFPETIALKERLESFFGISIESVIPETTLQEQEREFGGALWERRPDTCCTIRKVEPLRERLQSLSLWITGVRQEQGASRQGTGILERYLFDPLRDRYILKLNPMKAWRREAVWDYIHTHGIPYNPLHDAGFRSIGCWPCTKASAEGGDERAGRWTGFDKTECGIHTFLTAAN